MILRCYPNVSAILRRHTKSYLLCFSTIPPFNSQNILFTCIIVTDTGNYEDISWHVTSNHKFVDRDLGSGSKELHICEYKNTCISAAAESQNDE